jgi:RNA polymerase sigma-70 factor (ECF subfamily)
MTDAALVARILQGDRAAGAELVNRYYAGCWGYAYRLLGNREDAEDALQDTFLRAFRSLHNYQERYLFRAWLYRILTNQCRTILLQRRRRNDRFICDDNLVRNAHDPSIQTDTIFDQDDQMILLDKLQHGLARLEPMQREAFLLKYGEQLEYTEMAEITGSSVSALKMRVKRACDILRPLIQEALNA